MTNEDAFTMVEHAIDYLSGFGARYYSINDPCLLSAIAVLYEAHKSIGPIGQIPSWEENNAAAIKNCCQR